MAVRNPKTGRVLKNPEKFIEQLQAKLKVEELRGDFQYLQSQQARGEEIVTWKEHTKTQSTNSSNHLFSLDPGDMIAIVGRVVSVKGSKCKAGNRESEIEIEYEVLQTRRMPEDW